MESRGWAINAPASPILRKIQIDLKLPGNTLYKSLKEILLQSAKIVNIGGNDPMLHPRGIHYRSSSLIFVHRAG